MPSNVLIQMIFKLLRLAHVAVKFVILKLPESPPKLNRARNILKHAARVFLSLIIDGCYPRELRRENSSDRPGMQQTALCALVPLKFHPPALFSEFRRGQKKWGQGTQ